MVVFPNNNKLRVNIKDPIEETGLNNIVLIIFSFRKKIKLRRNICCCLKQFSCSKYLADLVKPGAALQVNSQNT